MGTVYRATQRSLNREVAVKVARPSLAADPLFAARFEREAKLLATLDHPAIVAVHDYGQVEGQRYLVMELVRGRPLRRLIDEGLSPRQAIAIAGRLCDALAHAHARGVVHRDLKPQNVIVDEQGQPHLADFGLSRMVGDLAGTSITEASVMGTPVYIAPERAVDGSEGDHRADLYALGVLLYEMLTGRPPLGNYRPPSRLAAVGPAADALIDRALQPDPEDRFGSAGDLKAALEAIPVLDRPAPAGTKLPVLALSRGDRFAKLLLLAVGIPIVLGLLAGMPPWLGGLGIGAALAIHALRQAWIFVREPAGTTGTRAGFRFLYLVTSPFALVAAYPRGLVLFGIDWVGLEDPTRLGIRLLLVLVAAAGVAGVVYLARTRRVRLLPLLRGHVEPAAPEH